MKVKSVTLSAAEHGFAEVLDTAVRIGMVLLVISFLIYLLGIVPSRIPPSALAGYWGLSLHEFQKSTGAPTGWGWIRSLTYGDHFPFIGIAFMTSVTFICYLRIIPPLLRVKDHVYVCIALAEIIVLVLAASGVLQAGH
ncbi:MAG: hypothetical protein AABZ39_06330 [Spirochaetota bacterium]